MFLPIVLAVAVFIVFFNAIFHPFVHDDIVFIVQNPHIAQLDHLAELFFQPQHQSAAGLVNGYYRPVLEVFYRLEYRIFGFNAWGFHFVNIFIHAVNGLILFAILCRLNFSRMLAFVVSLIFLIHPLQTEAVDCVAGISNLLLGLFVLWTIHSYISHRYFLTILGLVLALLTKEQAVVLLPLVILIDTYQGKHHKYFLWFLFAFFTVIFLALRTMVTGSHLIDEIFRSPNELQLRLLSIPNTILMYLRLIIVPTDLHYYRNTDILHDAKWGFVGFSGLLILITFVCRKYSKIKSDILFGLMWFLLSLFPLLNIVPLINEYSLIFTAEHFLYLPMLGIVLALSVILREIISIEKLRILTVLICLNFAAITVMQNNYWKDEITLFERMVIFEKNFARGNILLAKAYDKEGQIDRAIYHFLKALEIMQGYEQKASNERSKDFYRLFVKDLHIDLAKCYQQKGLLDDAMFYYREALTMQPSNTEILKSMGEILMQNSDFDQALNLFNQILSLDTNSRDFSLLNNIAICYASLSDQPKAEQYFKLSLGINPSYKPARDNLNKLLSSN